VPGGQLAEVQRDRILAAAVEVVAEIGYARLTVGAVIGRARISRKTFYEVFDNREDCFVAVFEETLSHARLVVSEAYARESSWCAGIRSALRALLARIDDDPALARLLVVEALGAGKAVMRLRAQALAELAKVIDQGRRGVSAKNQPPEISAEGLVGSISAVLHARLLTRTEGAWTDLLGPLMYMIVLPYLGPRAARRELSKPAPQIPVDTKARSPLRSIDPLDGLTMRLTYRTVMVLGAIADHPGASNREIAERSGVIDQGQISKLLNRLARQHLIENHGAGQEKGAANAWQLTQRGTQIARFGRLG
jgi:AcrR family transcriptional regulator